MMAAKRRQTPPAITKKSEPITGPQKLKAFLKFIQPSERGSSESTVASLGPDEPFRIGRPQKLGVFLLKVAQIAERMALHEHEQMIRDHLHKTPPLHPRRTLDQAYYWTLKSTEERDRDQVVYRATAPVRQFMHHHFCKENDKEKCTPQHCDENYGCRQCKRDSRQLPRVVMVDQLWLWVLNSSMLFFSFFSNLFPACRHE
jgi:hypothetical protein